MHHRPPGLLESNFPAFILKEHVCMQSIAVLDGHAEHAERSSDPLVDVDVELEV